MAIVSFLSFSRTLSPPAVPVTGAVAAVPVGVAVVGPAIIVLADRFVQSDAFVVVDV